MSTPPPIKWDSTPQEWKAYTAWYLRTERERTRPPLPQDGSVGQYNAWTEMMVSAIGAPDRAPVEQAVRERLDYLTDKSARALSEIMPIVHDQVGLMLRRVDDGPLLEEVFRRFGYETDNEGQMVVYTGYHEEGWDEEV